MHFKRFSNVRPEELPLIEDPFFARTKIDECGFDSFGADSLDCAFSRRAEHRQRMEREVEDGSFVLIVRHPFAPIVCWKTNPDGTGRWAPTAFVPSHMQFSLSRKLEALNRSGRGPRAYGFGAAEAAPRAAPAALAGAPVSPEPAQPAPRAAKSQRETRLYIGVFFDGTRNHKDNDRRLSDRDVTNIAKLHDLYPDEPGRGMHAIYIHGVGTITGEVTEDGFRADESLRGLALAAGPQGGRARIAFAIERLREALRGHSSIAEIVFDVFGFSRGASLARHFVNLMHQGLPELNLPADIERSVRFVGLFDTVASFYTPGDDWHGGFNLHLGRLSAEQVAQLSAHHEFRRNFPLHSLRDESGRLPRNFFEEALPGVHADVGGGYENPEVDFANVESLPVRWRRGLGSSGETVRLAQQEAAARGLDIEVVNGDVVEVERRHTRKELAIYALHRMHALARAGGVPLRPLEEDDSDHRLPEDLAHRLTQWQATGGRPVDARRWLEPYIHTSHRRGDMVNRPEPNGVRRVLPNRPGEAVRPRPAAARASA